MNRLSNNDRCRDQSGYVVWPGRCQPRGFEQSSIGFGRTARQAWQSVTLKTPGALNHRGNLTHETPGQQGRKAFKRA
jgi:hypothetical protein